MTDVGALVLSIRNPHRRRLFCISQQSKLDRSLESYVRINCTDWRPDASDKERAAANKKVQVILSRIRGALKEAEMLRESTEAWTGMDALQVCLAANLLTEDDLDVAELVRANDLARSHFDATRLACEKQMRALAKQLPVFPWVKQQLGFGDLNLAIIVGEAGDLSDYPRDGSKHGDAALWKRLGLGVIDGVRQGGLSKGANADDWIRHGYNRKRRSNVFVLGECVIKAQVRNVKGDDGEPTGERHAIGAYGETYLKRKALERARNTEMSDMHVHRRAQRYMEKRLLRHLWQAWRRVRSLVSEKTSMPLPAAPIHLGDQ